MEKYNVSKIVYSSSAAVYGAPQKEGLIDETHPTEPINFYGFSKLEGERLIKWYSELKQFSGVCLRYFNVAGDGGLYYVDPNARNIFPILAEVLSGKRKQLEIFGNDYKTSDGTGVRDYIHVLDLVDAHIKALNLSGFHSINLGSGKGYTVLELVKAFEKASKKQLPYIISPRREGDPALLVASSQKAKMLLNWQPKHTLDQMVESTLRAYKKSAV
jgi:UDP-glucose 4-epimerase